MPDSGRVLTLRAGDLYTLAPGWMVTVAPGKMWRHGGNPYLSGKVIDSHLDARRLGLTPLALTEVGEWDPREEFQGEEGEPIEVWARPIIARGVRRQYEMEQVLPGADPDDPFSDPIVEAVELREAGDHAGARQLLMRLLDGDLRCLDAHAHLGGLVFDLDPADALRHYEAGGRIGELSLGGKFDGLLPWGYVDNRPFLRCLQGFGLCLWRLGRFAEAYQVFERLLWLNPSDNLGVRFCIDDVKAGRPWRE